MHVRVVPKGVPETPLRYTSPFSTETPLRYTSPFSTLSVGEARFLCIQSEERPESDNWFQFVLNFDEVLRVKVPN